MEFIEYPKCTTCQKAKKYLENNKIDFIDRSITNQTPTKEEIKTWIEKYNIEIDKLFNTSGLIYRKLNLKEKKETLSQEEKINLLSSNGMLIKRPLLITKNKILIGFKEKQWNETLKS